MAGGYGALPCVERGEAEVVRLLGQVSPEAITLSEITRTEPFRVPGEEKEFWSPIEAELGRLTRAAAAWRFVMRTETGDLAREPAWRFVRGGLSGGSSSGGWVG